MSFIVIFGTLSFPGDCALYATRKRQNMDKTGNRWAMEHCSTLKWEGSIPITCGKSSLTEHNPRFGASRYGPLSCCFIHSCGRQRCALLLIVVVLFRSWEIKTVVYTLLCCNCTCGPCSETKGLSEWCRRRPANYEQSRDQDGGGRSRRSAQHRAHSRHRARRQISSTPT